MILFSRTFVIVVGYPLKYVNYGKELKTQDVDNISVVLKVALLVTAWRSLDFK